MNGVLLRDCRVVVPQELQTKVTTMLHQSRRGVVRMKTMPRLYVCMCGARTSRRASNAAAKRATSALLQHQNQLPTYRHGHCPMSRGTAFTWTSLASSRLTCGCWSWTPTQSGPASFGCNIFIRTTVLLPPVAGCVVLAGLVASMKRDDLHACVVGS